MKTKIGFYLKILLVFLIIILITIPSVSCANSKIYEKFSKVVEDDLSIDTFKNSIYSILLYIGWGVAICVTLITGLQYITVSNPQKRAALKEKLLLIVLGVVVLTAGLPLLRVIAKLIMGLWNIN